MTIGSGTVFGVIPRACRVDPNVSGVDDGSVTDDASPGIGVFGLDSLLIAMSISFVNNVIGAVFGVNSITGPSELAMAIVLRPMTVRISGLCMV